MQATVIVLCAIFVCEIKMCQLEYKVQELGHPINTGWSNRTEVFKRSRRVNRNNLITISTVHTITNRTQKRNKIELPLDFCSHISRQSKNKINGHNHSNLIEIKTSSESFFSAKFCLLNAQSVRNKFNALNNYIVD
jgi:hypothetical protein